jgi:chemotaxis signal transduction protein
VLRGSQSEITVRCRGCREIVPLPHATSDYLAGIIELDGQCIPVIDANVRFFAIETEIGHCSSILIVEHKSGATRFRTGVVVSDIEEVMQLAAGASRLMGESDVSVNMQFVIEACRSAGPPALLIETHRELRSLGGERPRHLESLAAETI